MNHTQSAKDWIQKQYRKSQAYLPEHTFNQKSGCQAHMTRAYKAHQPNSLHINKKRMAAFSDLKKRYSNGSSINKSTFAKFYAGYIAFIIPNK
ncbi:hypothetical protein [Prochlorococcus marinus]|uniref:hypothetical protein n=1 Tax=Prochlorococcus marinus TaxID=1219 RepID=UPI0012FF335B|nr:hypothetical protein [Prochlorococcus marinus]